MKRVLPVILIIILISSCGRANFLSSNKKAVKAEIDQINDSLQLSWNTMIDSDDRKLSDLQRLLQEVSYTKDHDEKKLHDLLSKSEQLKRLRYQQKSMTSNQIDNYDAQTDSLLKASFLLVEETEEMKTHSLTSSLIEDIKKADGQVILNRVNYDNWAKRFNTLVKEKEKTLSRIGPPYSSYKPLPLFQLPLSQE